MFVQLEVLHVDGDDIDYEAMGIEPPEDILAFKPVWLNLTTISHIEPTLKGETIVRMSNGKALQLNITDEKLLIMIDMCGLLLDVDSVNTLKKAS